MSFAPLLLTHLFAGDSGCQQYRRIILSTPEKFQYIRIDQLIPDLPAGLKIGVLLCHWLTKRLHELQKTAVLLTKLLLKALPQPYGQCGSCTARGDG